LREFEERETSRKPVEVTVNTKEENSLDFYLDFGQEFGLTKQINGLHTTGNFLKHALQYIKNLSAFKVTLKLII
jgi:hypothetical protein